MQGFDSPAICEMENRRFMERIEIGSAEWTQLKKTIISEFMPGQLIKHEWLWAAFRLEDFSRAEFGDYEKPADLIAAVKKADIDYMDLMSELRHELLVERKGLLVNIFGKGYGILPADEQVGHAFDKFISTVSRLIRKTKLIMNHVPPVSAEQNKIDRDLKAKFSLHEQMFAGMKK